MGLNDDLKKDFNNDQKESNDEARELLAQRFMKNVENKLASEESLRLNNGEIMFHAVDPANKYNPWWTVLLIGLLVVSLGVIVLLIGRGASEKSIVSEQEKVLVYNNVKSKFDQGLIEATNKLIEAENSFNVGKYSQANTQSKEAEDKFNTALDLLYDVKIVELGTDFTYLDEYNQNLEKATDLGIKMSKSLAYASRAADRQQLSEAKTSLVEYQGYGEDFDLLCKKVATYKSTHKDFFG